MLGSAATSKSDSADDEELSGAPAEGSGSNDEIINEDLGSLHDLLSQVELREGGDE